MRLLGCLAILLTATASAEDVLIQGGTVIDGTGSPARIADVRVRGNRIVAVGPLSPESGEKVVEARGLYIAPGFIDAHSHADASLDKLESQVRQGITTAVVGQDGSRRTSVREQMQQANGALINFAFFSGHGGLRTNIMGSNPDRKAAPFEIERMRQLLEEDMQAGAIGLSSGLEYNPGFHASRHELIELAKVASKHGGMYISHVRDETAGIFNSLEEVFEISRTAKLPGQVSHIKMGVAQVWGRARDAIRAIDAQRTAGIPITADVYPYTYWQSTIRVLTNSRDWGNRQVWVDALRDVGGASNVRLTTYSPDPDWAGKTLEQIAKATGKPAPDLIMHIINATEEGKGQESVLVTAMTEPDLIAFLRHPAIMFCSDGSGGGSHPRGAGSFPRILGRYVREKHVLTWEEAIRKMTSFPAKTFKLSQRGELRPKFLADIVAFDPHKIADVSTPDNPTAHAVGFRYAWVNGAPVLSDGIMVSGEHHAGISLKRGD